MENEVQKHLITTSREPKSALELSERFGILIAQCYRRIRALVNAGLVKAVDRVAYKRREKKAQR